MRVHALVLIWVEPIMCFIGGIMGLFKPEHFLTSVLYIQPEQAARLVGTPLGKCLVGYAGSLTILFGAAVHLVAKSGNARAVKFFFSISVSQDLVYIYYSTISAFSRDGNVGLAYYFGTALSVIFLISRLAYLWLPIRSPAGQWNSKNDRHGKFPDPKEATP